MHINNNLQLVAFIYFSQIIFWKFKPVMPGRLNWKHEKNANIFFSLSVSVSLEKLILISSTFTM